MNEKLYFQAEKKEEENKEEDVKIDVDLSALSESEKLALLNKECPELLTYIEDYKRKYIYGNRTVFTL